MVVHVKDLAKLGRRKGPSSSPGLKVLPGNWVVMPHLEKEALFREGLTFFACRIQGGFPRLIKAPLTDSEAVTKSAKAFHLDCGDSKKGKGRHFTSDKIHIHFARNFKSRGGDGSISLWRDIWPQVQRLGFYTLKGRRKFLLQGNWPGRIKASEDEKCI